VGVVVTFDVPVGVGGGRALLAATRTAESWGTSTIMYGIGGAGPRPLRQRQAFNPDDLTQWLGPDLSSG